MAINRLNDLYVNKKEELVANSIYKCSTHNLLLGLLTAVGIFSRQLTVDERRIA